MARSYFPSVRINRSNDYQNNPKPITERFTGLKNKKINLEN